MDTLDPDRLAPPPSTSTSRPSPTMATSSRDSDQSSNSSHGSPLVSKLDASDPLSFLMDSVAADVLSGSESSADDSFASSTSPSVHDSPAVDWATHTSNKDTVSEFWGQSGFPDLSFDAPMNYDPNTFNMPLTLEYMLSNPLIMDSNSIPSNHAPYPFSFQADNIPSLMVSSGDGSDIQPSDTSSSAASVSSESPVPEPAQLQPSQTPIRTEVIDNQSVEELARKALQAVGVPMALPSGTSQQCMLFLFSWYKRVNVPPQTQGNCLYHACIRHLSTKSKGANNLSLCLSRRLLHRPVPRSPPLQFQPQDLLPG